MTDKETETETGPEGLEFGASAMQVLRGLRRFAVYKWSCPVKQGLFRLDVLFLVLGVLWRLSLSAMQVLSRSDISIDGL